MINYFINYASFVKNIANRPEGINVYFIGLTEFPFMNFRDKDMVNKNMFSYADCLDDYFIITPDKKITIDRKTIEKDIIFFGENAITYSKYKSDLLDNYLSSGSRNPTVSPLFDNNVSLKTIINNLLKAKNFEGLKDDTIVRGFLKNTDVLIYFIKIEPMILGKYNTYLSAHFCTMIILPFNNQKIVRGVLSSPFNSGCIHPHVSTSICFGGYNSDYSKIIHYEVNITDFRRISMMALCKYTPTDAHITYHSDERKSGTCPRCGTRVNPSNLIEHDGEMVCIDNCLIECLSCDEYALKDDSTLLTCERCNEKRWYCNTCKIGANCRNCGTYYDGCVSCGNKKYGLIECTHCKKSVRVCKEHEKRFRCSYCTKTVYSNNCYMCKRNFGTVPYVTVCMDCGKQQALCNSCCINGNSWTCGECDKVNRC